MDRNRTVSVRKTNLHPSLSARRAWIEITSEVSESESLAESLSARRAWIEIAALHDILKLFSVALRKESVDRNRLFLICRHLFNSRSPQGERG